jgi:catechol 2,3-dioxygenase-like lactoylglutathione lyase family enzyme
VDHLAIPVSDQERSRRFYESYCGFGAKPARSYDDGVVMLYNAAGFALALGPYEPVEQPDWMHFGFGLPDRRTARILGRTRLHHRGVVGAVVTGSKFAGSAGS